MQKLLPILTAAVVASSASAQILSGTEFNRKNANLWCYYEAKEGVNGSATALPHGTPVTRWNDLGPGARHLLNPYTTPPSVGKSPKTCGLTAVEFNDSFIRGLTTDPGFTTDLTNEMTVFVVAKPYAGERRYVFDGNQSRRAFFLGQTSCPTDWTMFIGGQGTWGCGQKNPFAIDRYQFHTIVFGKGKQEHYINGTLTASGSYPSVGALGGLTLGGRVNGVLRFKGAIAMFAIFDRVITKAERQLVDLIMMPRFPLGYSEAYGSGRCTDNNGRAALLRTPSCIMSPGTLELTLAATTPNQPTTLFISLGRDQITLGPCDVLIKQPMLLNIPGTTSATGTFSTGNITVPSGIKALVNIQALVLDPATPFGGSLSNGLELNYK